MTLLSKVGSFLTGTGAVSSNVVVNDVGFQPKAVIFWWTGATGSVDALFNANNSMGMGWAVSSSSRSNRAAASRDARTSSATNKNRQSDEAITVHPASGSTTTVDGSLDFVSFDSGGFTLIVDDQFVTSFRIGYLALGGDDITNVFAANGRSIPGGTGNEAVTGVGFKPDIVFFACNRITTSGSNGTNAEGSFGAAVSSSQQAILFGGAPSGQLTMDAKSYSYDGECLGAGNTSATFDISCRGTFVSMDSDGFTINWLELAAGSYDYLCIKGGQWLIGSLLTQTDTSTDIVESGFGFTPKFGMFFSHTLPKSTQNVVDANWSNSVGAFDSASSRIAEASYMENATADSECDSAVEFDEVYINIGASDAVVGLMDIKSVDADGFTCIMDDADPAQAFVWYVAAGNNKQYPVRPQVVLQALNRGAVI
jgi:hypothetical protein